MTYQPGPYPPQYQNPYPYPPGYGYDPMQAMLTPARRAGLLMIIMGFLMLACSLCCIGVVLIPPEQLQEQLTQMESRSGQATPLTAEELRMGSIAIMVVLIGLGLPTIIVGFLVRRGGGASITVGIVLSILLLVLVGLYLVAGVVRGGGAADLVVGLCTMILPVTFIVLQLVWLVQAMRARGAIQAMQTQYQQQYWQYGQQQQQMYGYAPGAGNPNVPAPTTNQVPNPSDQTGPGGPGGGFGTGGPPAG